MEAISRVSAAANSASWMVSSDHHFSRSFSDGAQTLLGDEQSVRRDKERFPGGEQSLLAEEQN
jgi:hypothetical protein